MGSEISFPYADNVGIKDDTVLGIPSYSLPGFMENWGVKWEGLHGTLPFTQRKKQAAQLRDE